MVAEASPQVCLNVGGGDKGAAPGCQRDTALWDSLSSSRIWICGI